jgi:Domain of unknown function (DUF397)
VFCFWGFVLVAGCWLVRATGCDRWRTSSYSGGNGGECVQVEGAPGIGRVLVRDSKNPDGPVLAVPSAEWRRFIGHVAGRYAAVHRGADPLAGAQ